MKNAYLSVLMVGVFATGLSIIPPFVEARTFGYVGIKSGYSYEGLARSTFSENGKVTYLDASSALGIPLVTNAGFGHDFSPRFGMRVEAEYAYRFGGKFKGGVLNDTQTQANPNANPMGAKPQAKIQSLLGNVYLDYYLSPWASLYLSGGVGVGHLDITTELQKASGIEKITSPAKMLLAWQAGFGLNYMLTGNVGFDLNLRYVDFGKGAFSSQKGILMNYPFFGIEALIGLNYRF